MGFHGGGYIADFYRNFRDFWKIMFGSFSQISGKSRWIGGIKMDIRRELGITAENEYIESKRKIDAYIAYQNEYKQKYGVFPELDKKNKPVTTFPQRMVVTGICIFIPESSSITGD